MNELDKKAAEACGVVFQEYMTWGIYDFPNEGDYIEYDCEWTLDDARCREIVREHFLIDTTFASEGVECFTIHNGVDIEPVYGKTIAEAEIACIKAILEHE